MIWQALFEEKKFLNDAAIIEIRLFPENYLPIFAPNFTV